MLAGIARLAFRADLPDLQDVGTVRKYVNGHSARRQSRGRRMRRGQRLDADVVRRQRYARQPRDGGEIS